jgi:hypothetical protein
VLDQLSDTDAELRPRSSAQSADVAESNQHLARGDLEAYSSGGLTPARLTYCQTHLDSCEDCRAELEDLRTHKGDLSSFLRPEPSRRELQQRRRRRRLALQLTASAATVLVATVATFLWRGYEKSRVSKSPTAVAIAQSQAAPTTPGALPAQSTSATPGASGAAGTSAAAGRPPALSTSTAPGTPAAAAARALQNTPVAPSTRGAPTTRLAGVASPSPSAPQANTGFVLLGPFGEAISETRPQFRWQPLAGAIGYSVVIVDPGLHPVQRSPAIRATTWRPRRPLHRGRTYLWQVTATLRGGKKVVASGPPTSETLLRIVPAAHPAR